jgi:ferredoxin
MIIASPMKTTRRIVQAVFVLLTLVCVFAVGANAESWCPLGGVEALYTYFREGNLVCSLGVSNFYILAGALVMALLLRRAFCGYMCPIGAISEWFHAAARRLGVPALRVPRSLDRALAAFKYAILAAILVFTWQAGELLFRGYCPAYALVSRHGADITWWAYVFAGAIVSMSLVIVIPFCRWFCPFAAVLHPFSRFALARVKRDPAACTGCRRCERVCPMAIPVAEVSDVTAARCLACLDCVEACPQQSAGALAWGPPRRLGGRWPQAALVAILLACTAGAVSAAYLYPMASFIKVHGAPPATPAVIELKIENLTCRGRANLLVWFLQRDDFGPPLGYFKVEAWPGSGPSLARITYDPGRTDEEALKRTITEPYFQVHSDAIVARWFHSPFRIVGYDPLAAIP